MLWVLKTEIKQTLDHLDEASHKQIIQVEISTCSVDKYATEKVRQSESSDKNSLLWLRKWTLANGKLAFQIAQVGLSD